ncbi:MAG: GNAT family N-acetyltransferase [Microthrixaceae bacterium]
MQIRRFRAEDLDELYLICLRTAAAGSDATGLLEEPNLFGDLFAAPYAVLEPEHCHVLAEGSGPPLGYVLGTLDAVAFEERCEIEWWPQMRQFHPRTVDGDGVDDLLIALIHDRPVPRHDLRSEYPSELHIDLLPEVQGLGWGRRLMESMFAGLNVAGSPGVHLGVSDENSSAVAFYRHLGLEELCFDGITRVFGKRL